MWVDPENLRARGAAFRAIGDEVRQVTERLRTALAQEGRWWGDDEAGAAFERSYGPDALRLITALQALSDGLLSFGSQITTAAGTAETADRSGATAIVRSGAHPVVTPKTSAIPVPRPGPDTAEAGPRRDPGQGMPSPAASLDPGKALAGGPETAGSPAQVAPPHAVTTSSSPGPGAFSTSEPPEPASATGADPTIAEGAPRPNDARGAAPADRNRERPARHGGPAATDGERERPNVPAAARTHAIPAVSARGGRKPPGTPWTGPSSPPGRPSPAAGIDRPRGDVPVRADNGTRNRPPAGRKTNKPVPTPGSVARRAAENPLMRQAAILAERHGFEVRGFDAADLDESAVAQFLDATDDVLTRYPVIRVRRVEIGRAGQSRVVRIEPQGGADDPPNWSVTLDGGVAAGPDPLGAVTRRRCRPGMDYERPLYAATVREFGNAFDLAGGHRARDRAQRALIAEYLGGNEFRTTELARVVAGYKRWRDQLSDNSFDQGRFDAAEALADGFTEVMLRQDAASEPSKALCRLLVEHARGGERAGKREG